MKDFTNSNEPLEGKEEIKLIQGGMSMAPTLKAEIQSQKAQFKDHTKSKRRDMKQGIICKLK